MELKGIGVSPGIGVGPALLVEREDVAVFRLLVAPAGVEGEVARLARAIDASALQLQSIRERLNRGRIPHGYVFEAQLLMLEDPLLRREAEAVIREDHVNAEWALHTVAERLHRAFADLIDPYLRERGHDVDDVLGRVLLNLRGAPDAPSLSRLPGRVVLIADHLAPSEAADLDWERVAAVVTDAGSPTHHTSILARSFGVPAVAGLRDATRLVPAGSLIVVDGASGRVVVEPSGVALAGFRAAQEAERREQERLQSTRPLPAVTVDGTPVILRANVEFPAEAVTALLYGAEGIGLFRSEYLLGRRHHWPDEERQVAVYRQLGEPLRPHPVTVRLWDVGAEEVSTGPSSPNPALGLRALRLLACDPAPYRTQIRALLRAAAHVPLRILLPFVSGPTDLALALDLVRECRAQLAGEGIEHRADVPIGLMLEVPGAVLTADLLAPRVDFLCVGTNDLVQFLLAVDRADPRLSAHYQPFHPAVLRALQHAVVAGQGAGRPVSLCGEMAAEPRGALLLLGLGVRELSMSPAALPRVKSALRSVTRADAEDAAHLCLEKATASEVIAVLEERFGPVAGAAVTGVEENHGHV